MARKCGAVVNWFTSLCCAFVMVATTASVTSHHAKAQAESQYCPIEVEIDGRHYSFDCHTIKPMKATSGGWSSDWQTIEHKDGECLMWNESGSRLDSVPCGVVPMSTNISPITADTLRDGDCMIWDESEGIAKRTKCPTTIKPQYSRSLPNVIVR